MDPLFVIEFVKKYLRAPVSLGEVTSTGSYSYPSVLFTRRLVGDHTVSELRQEGTGRKMQIKLGQLRLIVPCNGTHKTQFPLQFSGVVVCCPTPVEFRMWFVWRFEVADTNTTLAEEQSG